MKRGETFLPDDFRLTGKTLAWLAEKNPTVDVEETLERFIDKAAAKGWRYRDWQAAFRNYVRNGKQYGGVTYKGGMEHDPRWIAVLAEARKFGFRDPQKLETPAVYKTAFEMWKREPKPSNVLPLRGVLKRVS